MLFDGIFVDGKLPDIDTVFHDVARETCDVLKRYDYLPHLDDSGDEIESVVSNLYWVWEMYFFNDGQCEGELYKYFGDYVQSFLRNNTSPAKYDECCDDIRLTYIDSEFQIFLDKAAGIP